MTTALSSNPRKLVQVEKKANVIQRTTSETIRLGESELIVTNCVRFVPGNNAATTRKKTPTNAAGGSFQITAVCLTRSGDAGDDSADDLDESHTDDISRITDNETPSISEDSRDPDYFFPNVFPETQHLPPIIAPEEEIIKIIEIESPLKIRGRWTCLDYDDKKNNKDDQIADFRSSSILNCDVHIGQKVYEVLLPESSSTGVENNYLLDVAALLSTTSIAEASSKTPENCSKAIDTKIEQAMDLVKSHLMVLVRQDVEILKVKITELLGRIKQLETENSYLRANAGPNVLHTLPLKSGEKPAIQAPPTKIICQQNQPNHCSQIIPQNSIKQLCQNHQTQCQPTQQNYQPQSQPNYVPIPQNQTTQQITNQPAQYINQPLQQNNYIPQPQIINQNIKPIQQNQLPIQIIQPSMQQNNQPLLINNHPVVLNNQTFQNSFSPIQQNNQPIQTTVVPIQNNYALQQNQIMNRSNQAVVQQNNYNIQPNQHIVRQSQFQIQQTYQPNNSVTTPVVYQTIQAYPQAR